jgi:hypothetical protein
MLCAKRFAGSIALWVVSAATPAAACCDWTERDTAFWQRMSESPRKFSFEMEARPSPYRLVVKDREIQIAPDSARPDADWHEIYHALTGERKATTPPK